MLQLLHVIAEVASRPTRPSAQIAHTRDRTNERNANPVPLVAASRASHSEAAASSQEKVSRMDSPISMTNGRTGIHAPCAELNDLWALMKFHTSSYSGKYSAT